ncbi:MAG: GFA family protein [Methylobacter sp.]|nr:GFA family protein [Methylobacter sp.]
MREHFRWVKGEEKLSSFESSPGKLRYFCSKCGSHLVAERVNQPHVIVRVATLDENPNVTPQAPIWTSHNVPWLEYEDIPSYPEWPPGR